MNLSALSEATRKAVIIIIVGIIAIILLRIGYILVAGLVTSLLPAKPTPPNNLFGTLHPIKFPTTLSSSKNYIFSLETVDAKLPTNPNLMKVYKVNQTPALFMSLTTAKQNAQNFGFRTEPTSLGDNKYQFKDINRPGYVLTSDIITGNTSLKIDPNFNPNLLANRLTIDTTAAQKYSWQFLTTHQLVPSVFAKGTAMVKFLKISAKNSIEVASADQANGYRVDIFPPNLDTDYQILTPNPDFSPLNVTFLAGQTGNDVYELNTFNFDLDTTKVGTYQIISVQTAWDNLNSGKATILHSPTSGKQINIQNITLGYFLEDNATYLKPVYIFSGTSSVDLLSPDFIAVLPAVAP